MSQAPQPPGTDGPSSGSRSKWVYAAVGAGVAVLAVVLFLALRPGDDDGETLSDTAPAADTTPTVETTTTVPAEEPQRIEIEVEGGQPVGGIQTADIVEGTLVRIVVRADVTDEVHLHGYDLSADVTPDQPARITFRADVPGEFEVELEGSGVQIAELTVSP
jgi:hypothetical protein